MKPHFTEFTYGYTLIEEISKAYSFRSVPTFPSLIEEGRVGGYDVELEISGLPIFLQFKRSDYLKRSNAKYYKYFSSEYYRFNLHALKYSKQHNLLLTLSIKKQFVFYVAPKFHSQTSLRYHYFNSNIVKNSIWISPQSIGSLPDNNAHSICFNKLASLVYFCSEPRKIDISSINRASNIKEYFSKKQSPPISSPFDKDIDELEKSEIIENVEELNQAEELQVSIWQKTFDTLRTSLIKEEPGFADKVLSSLCKEENVILKTAKLARIGFGLDMLIFDPVNNKPKERSQ